LTWTFAGHSTLVERRCKVNYDAIAVDGARALVMCGSESRGLSTYSVASGKTLSRGECGWHTSALAVQDERTGSGLVAAAHGGVVSLLRPAA
jgi:hypothetical protein